MIALLNISVLGFSFVFLDKAKRTQQGNLLMFPLGLNMTMRLLTTYGPPWQRWQREREMQKPWLPHLETFVHRIFGQIDLKTNQGRF